MNNKTESIGLRDFYAAAYLVSRGVELVSAKKENGLTVFEFQNNSNVQTLLNDFYGAKNLALSYSVAIRNLKAIIHSETISKRNDYVSQSIKTR